ncbi:MAG: phosphoribosylglycinamide formyltransferase [Prevotellaceae bacterium]|jgi:phosphoribosylglycinamide formyltransferase-1|nr:phosphoribosylglycinamide formyltransferase [Prevotellaceae bacterium]
MPTKVAIFASGSGSNAENIINYFAQNETIKICLVLSNRSDAFVLERAKKYQIPSAVLGKKDIEEGSKLIEMLNFYDIDFIVLAGFLLKIPEYLINMYPNRIVNIHPALLPNYGGKGMYGHFVHEAVVAARETESGISVHFVNSNYDEGDIIFQAKCPVLPFDTPDDVAAKVHELEYIHFPQVIEQVIRTL